MIIQAQAVHDTVFVVQQQPGWQQWVNAFAGIAQIVLAIALLAVGIGVLFAALKVKALMKKVEEQGQKLRVDLAPAIRNVTTVSDHAVAVSKRVRGDVDRLSGSVTAATEKLQEAAKVAEQRVGEFNALLGVVQEEAEELFIGGASALRGARTGAETFRRFRSGDLEYLGEVVVEDEEIDDDAPEEREDGDGDGDGDRDGDGDGDGEGDGDRDEDVIEVELRRGGAKRGRRRRGG